MGKFEIFSLGVITGLCVVYPEFLFVAGAFLILATLVAVAAIVF